MRQNIAGKINGLAEVENRILGARTPLCGRKNAIGSHGSGKSGARNRGHRTASRLAPKAPQLFFIFMRPMKSRLPSGTPLVRRMS
jgi:hypothetical protein